MYFLFHQLYTDFLPQEFLVKDIKVKEDARHLLFATRTQLDLLAKARTWYVDATFKVVSPPSCSYSESMHSSVAKTP